MHNLLNKSNMMNILYLTWSKDKGFILKQDDNIINQYNTGNMVVDWWNYMKDRVNIYANDIITESSSVNHCIKDAEMEDKLEWNSYVWDQENKQMVYKNIQQLIEENINDYFEQIVPVGVIEWDDLKKYMKANNI